MSGWTVAEAAALLLDIDPDRLPEMEDAEPGLVYRRLFVSWIVPKMGELSTPMTPQIFNLGVQQWMKPPEQLQHRPSRQAATAIGKLGIKP